MELPHSALAPPSPPSDTPPDSPATSLVLTANHGRRRNRRHDDGNDDGEHRHRHRHGQSPAENNCCKWVRDVDDECVCELLMRLPTFLARPFHEYTITVSEWCKVTYSCGGRPRP
ncbi:hypothetical protein LINPERPRIM_LOCUS42937 [Linum perenne]